MANYANTHFEIYLKESDLKQQALLENPISDNNDQIMKWGDFVGNILKEKHKQKDNDVDVTLEKMCQVVDDDCRSEVIKRGSSRYITE